MKLITLNTHSIVEKDYEKKLRQFVDMIISEKPTIFSLQEVNQSLESPAADSPEKVGYIYCEGNDRQVRSDNHALRIATFLKEAGMTYEWTWIPLKIGYDIYEEGLAIFSLAPIEATEQFFISKIRDFKNWKTRKVLGVKAEGTWYYSVHMGWWDDKEDPFVNQWNLVHEMVYNKGSKCFVMGDFNCPSAIRGEGYDYVKNSGWFDTYVLAKEKDEGISVGHIIDGWHERVGKNKAGMRIDYIWCNKEVDVQTSQIVFNGEHYPVVSDHYGVQIVIN